MDKSELRGTAAALTRAIRRLKIIRGDINAWSALDMGEDSNFKKLARARVELDKALADLDYEWGKADARRTDGQRSGLPPRTNRM